MPEGYCLRIMINYIPNDTFSFQGQASVSSNFIRNRGATLRIWGEGGISDSILRGTRHFLLLTL